MMFPHVPPGTRLAHANEELIQAEASFSFDLKRTLTSGFALSSSDPNLSAFCSRVQSICDLITNSNASTTFISSAFEHLLVIQDQFAAKRGQMQNLEESSRSAAKAVSSLHNQLMNQQNAGDTRKLRDQVDSAIHSEESARRDLQSCLITFEAEFKDYQQEVARVIATLYGQVGEVRSQNEEAIAQEMRALLESGLNVSLNFVESDSQIEHEIAKLKKIVTEHEDEMSQMLRVRSFSGDSDLVLISERLSQDQLFRDSSEEDLMEVMGDKPLVSVDFDKQLSQSTDSPSSEPQKPRNSSGSVLNSMASAWYKVCSGFRAIKV
jgi:hypothetical protein